MSKEELKFQSTTEGYLEAQAWLKEIGEWDRVSTSGFSTDGWSVIAEANSIWNKLNQKSQ